MADEARIREVATEVVEPVQALAELLRQEKEDALTKAKTAESKAEASRLQCLELSKAHKASTTWARQLKISETKAKYKSLGDQRAIEYLKWEVSFEVFYPMV